MDVKNKSEKLNNLVKTNTKKSTDWCVKYGVLHNNISLTNNIFEETLSVSTNM